MENKSFKKQILFFVILAILVRVIIMPFFTHPDIKTFNYQSSFLKNGVWDIYTYISNNKNSLTIKEDFVYFPLTYFFLGGYQIIASPVLGPDFSKWLSNATAESLSSIGTFRYLFLLKLPYLFFDIAIAFLLMSFFNNENQKKKVLLVWLFNPFSIILIYIYSNFDVIPVFFTVLSLLFAEKKKLNLAALFLGLGVGFKAYPLIFLPLLFLYAVGWKQKLQVILITLGTTILIILPFASNAFRDATLISGLTTRILLPVVGLGFNEYIILPILALTILYFYIFIENKFTKENLIIYFFVTVLLVLSFIHYHIQWLLWAMPFAVLILVENSKNWLEGRLWNVMVLTVVIAMLVPIFLNDSSMTVSLLKPINYWYIQLQTPFLVISKIYNVYIVQSVLHTILIGAALVISLFLVCKKEK